MSAQDVMATAYRQAAQAIAPDLVAYPPLRPGGAWMVHDGKPGGIQTSGRDLAAAWQAAYEAAQRRLQWRTRLVERAAKAMRSGPGPGGAGPSAA
jgi:hypothetical protein